MPERRWLRIVRAAGLLLCCLFLTPRVHADTATETVTVHFDAGSLAPGHPMLNNPTRDSLVPWEDWAGGRSPGMAEPAVSPADHHDTMGWTNRKDHAGLEFVNNSRNPLRVHVIVRLPAGLWRAEAAVVPGAVDANGISAIHLPADAPPTLWRMQSVFCQSAGDVVRDLDLRQGAALYLRWTETGASAVAARTAVRRALWATTDHALQDRVAGALTPLDEILSALPVLVARGDREKITRRIHTALLVTAKAQALWDDGRGGSITNPDAAFTDLTVALSEVSCACFDLVPSQSIVVSATTGKPELRVGVTNAGSRTIPLVTLGVENADGSPAGSDRTVFRAVAPGATVSALFPVADPETAHGVVQFLSDMGAATVSAAPAGPVALTPKD